MAAISAAGAADPDGQRHARASRRWSWHGTASGNDRHRTERICAALSAGPPCQRRSYRSPYLLRACLTGLAEG
jgi:hypothetical protein